MCFRKNKWGDGGVVCGYSCEEGLLQTKRVPILNLQREAGSKYTCLQSPQKNEENKDPNSPILTKGNCQSD